MQNRVRIDKTDAKILKTLLEESRTSFTEIAKDVKLSVGAVRMRYKRLWKEGVITGEIMQVNPHSLGYKCISHIGIKTALTDKSEIKELLKNKPYIVHFIEGFGKYNFGPLVAMHSIQELSGILEDLQSNPLIIHSDAFIWAETIKVDHVKNLILKPFTNENEKRANQSPATISHEETRIDEKDRQIAKILSQNSRTPFRKIAEQLNISTKNVSQRYKKLRGKVLTLSSITVDLNKLGYKAQAGIFLKVANKSKIPEIYAQMLQIPNLIVAIRFIEPYDLFGVVVLEDFKELFKLTDCIHGIQDIEEIDTDLKPPFSSWPLNLFASLL